MASSGVRAKAALFGPLSSSGAGSGGIGTIELPPTSSASFADPSISHPLAAPLLSKDTARTTPSTLASLRVPGSISSSAHARDWPKDKLLSSSSSSSRSPVQTALLDGTSSGTVRRKLVEPIAELQCTSAKHSQPTGSTPISTSTVTEAPPIVPVKSYPPRLSVRNPSTPFALTFQEVKGMPLDSVALAGPSSHRKLSPQGQPHSRIPRYSVSKAVNGGLSGTSSILVRPESAALDLSRESMYSTTSSQGGAATAVVATANAVSIHRIAHQPRAVATVLHAGSSTHHTTEPIASSSTSLDKGIGVKTRRKSRERESSSANDRRRPKSGRSSTVATTVSTGATERIVDDNALPSGVDNSSLRQGGVVLRSVDETRTRQQERALPVTSTPADREPTHASSPAISAPRSAEGAPLEAPQSNRFTPSAATAQAYRNGSREIETGGPSAIRAGPIELSRTPSMSSSVAQVSREVDPWTSEPKTRGRYHSINSGVGVGVGGNGGGGGGGGSVRDGWSTSSVADALDPLSDAWGQNLSVASQYHNDDGMSSMSAFAYAPLPISPLSPVDNQQYRDLLTPAGIVLPRHPSSHPIGSNRNASMRQRNGAGSIGMVKATGKDSGTATSMLDIKDVLLTQLLASMSIVDAQTYPVLSSLEEVEALKRELVRIERRIVDVQHKLKVQMRMRDAADKLRRAGTRSRSGAHARSPSVASTTAGGHARRISSTSNIVVVDSQQQANAAEADVAQATRQVDESSRNLMDLFANAAATRRQLLEHHAGVLAFRVLSLEREVQNDQNRAEREYDEEEERAKVGAMLAVEELDQVRDKLRRIERTLQHERADREGEVQQWRKRHEEDTQSLRATNERFAVEADRNAKRLVEQHGNRTADDGERISELDKQVKAQEAEVAQHERTYEALRRQMDQLEFETTAERKIMLQRQNLFGAFEQRLERAERRLREQDERCARMLGKAEGRDEMDDLLSQIKYGAGGAACKKEKTAGQDIDELIDSLTTHINDIEDELMRASAAATRSFEQVASLDTPIRRGQDNSPSSLSVREAGTVRELAIELQSKQREAEEWRTQAEGAKRHLAALQRQSRVSMTSTNARLSISGWGGGGALSNAGGRRPSTTNTYMTSSRSAAELEARVALLEKRNAVLETELSHARNADSFDVHLDRSPPSKVAGIRSDGSYAATITSLLGILPALDPESTDLHEMQEELEAMPRNSCIDTSQANAKEVCRIVMDRTRAVLSVGRNLVGKALTLEMERRDYDEDFNAIEAEREELKVAMEDLRSGHAAQLQIIEANRARERRLHGDVQALQRALEETQRRDASVTAPIAPGMQSSPSLTSLISSQAGSGAGANGNSFVPTSTIAHRRNLMPIRGAKLISLSPASISTPSRGNTFSSLSPSSSKLSFTSNGFTATTPATSHPTWSPHPQRTRAANVPSLPSVPPSDGETERADAVGVGMKGRTASVFLSSTRTAAGGGQAQRTMMLGMGTSQMLERIRQLEADLSQTKATAHRSKADDEERTRLEAQLDTFRAELESNRREMDEIRNVESRQRIELLEELTTLTSELSEARSQIRQQQIRKDQQALQQKVMNV